MEDLTTYKDGLYSSTQESEITAIVGVLEDKRDKAVQERQDVESRWLRDLQQYEGNTIDRMTKGDTDRRGAIAKTPPVVHITRTRTLAIAARIINMLVPSNERSWDIEATPVPQMAERSEDNTPITDPRTGQIAMVPDLENEPGPEQNPMAVQDPNMPPGGMQPPGPPQGMPPGMDPNGMGPPGMQPGPAPQPPMRAVTVADLVKMEIEEAEKRAGRMREHMDDQLTECRYNAEQRKVIVDGCRLGTGILEGPVVGGSYKKTRSRLPDGQWVTQMAEESVPEFECIDPWSFYPIAAEHITRCEGVFIDKPKTRREMQELKLLPGFDKEMIDEVLREEPEQSKHYAQSMVSRANITGETQPTHNRYTVWKFTGSLTRDELTSLGVDVDAELDMVDPIIEAWFVNTRLIKIKRHALEGAYRLPYYVWNYEESEVTMFGYGVPYFMRDSDRVIQSTWHMILHNAAISAGPQIIRKKGAIIPADGSEQITGGVKQWYLDDPETTVNDAFGMFQIDARIDELVVVHERARQNADEELAFPLLAQGEPTEAVPTSSGMAMLLNATNVVQRRIAQSYDDEILEPSIAALYDYNMTYLEDEEAKGDMTIKAMGATKLVVKDMQAQHLMVLADITTNDRFAPLMKDAELLRRIIKSAEVDPDDLMKSEDEMQGQGPSPTEEAELALLQARAQKLQAEAQKMGAPDGDGGETAMYELQFKYDDLEAQLQIQQMRLQAAALQAAEGGKVKLADIEATFETNRQANETKKLIAELQERRKTFTEGYTARLKAHEITMKEQNLARGFDTYG